MKPAWYAQEPGLKMRALLIPGDVRASVNNIIYRAEFSNFSFDEILVFVEANI